MAERVGFEPTVGCPITSFQDWLLKPLGHLSVFKTGSLNRSDISPHILNYSIPGEKCQGFVLEMHPVPFSLDFLEYL